MLQQMGVGRWVGFAILAMVVIAIWKVNEGDLSSIAEGIWAILNRGADVVVTLWESFMGAPEESASATSGG